MWTSVEKTLGRAAMASTLAAVIYVGVRLITYRTPESSCQEVVAVVEQKGNVMATCPSGTYVDIIDDEVVVCRCGKKREPVMIDIAPEILPSLPPTQPLPNPGTLLNDNGRNDISL